MEFEKERVEKRLGVVDAFIVNHDVDEAFKELEIKCLEFVKNVSRSAEYQSFELARLK